MERTIASLEEQLAIANDENQQSVLRSESLFQEVEELYDKLGFTSSEVERLKETVSSLRANLERAGVQSQIQIAILVYSWKKKKKWLCNLLMLFWQLGRKGQYGPLHKKLH